MSKIEWTDITWNPVTGCEKISPGCQNCYAEIMHRRLRGMGNKKYKGLFNVPRCWPEELKRSFGKKPKKIFVCSMGDLFHDAIPWTFTKMVLNKIKENPQHTFQILTKRPNIALAFEEWNNIKWPDNIWFGVTAENQRELENRVPLLAAICVENTFVSIEPMLEKIVIPQDYFDHGLFSWVIVGGETGQNARLMNPDWARSIRDQLINNALRTDIDIPFFFKQMSKKLGIPADLMVKEFPNGG